MMSLALTKSLSLTNSLVLTNSLGGRKETFVPLRPDEVRMYVCGPTVYNFAHIGNARPAVVFDVLARVLRRRFPAVRYSRNITDVDQRRRDSGGCLDRCDRRALHRCLSRRHGRSRRRPTDDRAKGTDHIPDIVALIGRLIARGHAYAAKGHVLFHVPAFRDYGMLSRRSRDEMIAGARVEVAPYKKHPADFVLWKPSSSDRPGWDSPWGRGRPGWHIECSAMIERHLGFEIDIHGGGQDLIFPHHENEIAQGTRARFWIHNGFVTVDGAKMSKSLGNVLLVRDLLKEAPGEAIRYALLTAQYRQPLDWSSTGLRQAHRSLDRLYGVLRALSNVEPGGDATPYLAAFLAALDDDLNTPAAFAELFRLARMAQHENSPVVRASLKAALVTAGEALGLLQQRPEDWFAWTAVAGDGRADAVLDESEVEALVAERDQAREARDFVRADALRDRLTSLGIAVEDRTERTAWRRVSL